MTKIFGIILALCVQIQAQAKQGILIIPGLLSSHFKEIETQERKFFSLSDAWKDHSLALNVPSLKIPSAINLTPDGIIDSIQFWKNGPKVHIFDLLISELKNLDESKFELFLFDYDWRVGINQNARDLCKFISIKSHILNWTVIAHSMGGLITCQCFKSGKTNIENIVFAGTPFQGSILTLVEMIRGQKPWGTSNDHLLSALANQSFPSYYQLLPNPISLVINSNGEDITDEFYSSKFFINEKLGFFKDIDSSSPLFFDRSEYVNEQFNLAKDIQRDLHTSPQVFTKSTPLNILNIFSKTQETLSKIVYSPTAPKDLKKIVTSRAEAFRVRQSKSLTNQMFLPGDGAVNVESAKPYPWLKELVSSYEEYESRQGHMGLLAGKQEIQKVIDFILTAQSYQ